MKKTFLGAVILNQCPQCREGQIFEKKGAFRIKGLTEIHPSCLECECDFIREPGFFFGAAYVSYALTVALWVAVFVALVTFNAMELISYDFFKDPWMFLISGIVAVVVLMPAIYRLSRSIWLALFTKYKPAVLEKKSH